LEAGGVGRPETGRPRGPRRAARRNPANPQIRNYQFGDDAAIAEGNFEFAIVADFDNRSDFQSYAAADAHQKLIAEHIRPILQDRAAAQFEF